MLSIGLIRYVWGMHQLCSNSLWILDGTHRWTDKHESDWIWIHSLIPLGIETTLDSKAGNWLHSNMLRCNRFINLISKLVHDSYNRLEFFDLDHQKTNLFYKCSIITLVGSDEWASVRVLSDSFIHSINHSLTHSTDSSQNKAVVNGNTIQTLI